MPVRRALLEVNLRPRKFSSHLPIRGTSPFMQVPLAQNFVKWPQMSCPHCSWHAEGLGSAGAIVECPASKRSVLKNVREHWRTGFHPALCR